jgi:uncharacterized protein YjbJ (UPF0337 family)
MKSGKAQEVKGRVKEAAGVLTDDAKLKRKGKTDQVIGKLKQTVDKLINKGAGAPTLPGTGKST